MTTTELIGHQPSADVTARVRLKPRKARPFYGRHPWVLDSAIAAVDGHAEDGDVVELLSERGEPIARGIYNSRSRIRVRLYSWQPQQRLDEEFWRGRIARALALPARKLLDHPSGAVRLVSSEADGLGGMVVDRYADHLMLHISALAMASRLETLVPLLMEQVAPRGLAVRVDRTMARYEGLAEKEDDAALAQFEQRWQAGQPADDTVFIVEHGLRYGVDLATGQKSGFYLDQRDNRLAAARYMQGRSVLDVCCYSGGFSLAAIALGGATEALGIDASAKAVALAKANALLNDVKTAQFEVGDCFQTLQHLATERRRYGAVVLDPPKFAGQRGQVDKALRAYHQLNRMAVDLLDSDGILVTCSCSGYVTREDLLHVLAQVAQRSGRNIQVLEQRGAAPDHPVSVTCLENEYLKCLICCVR